MTPLIALHAVGAALALLLGPFNILRRIKGDRPHRVVGRVWVGAMYWTVLTSFFVREIEPGHFSWLHGQSAFTFLTLSIGLWAAMTGRIKTHRRNMVGSYLGLVVAFIFAAGVPSRHLPQFAGHHPVGLTVSAVIIVLVAAAIVVLPRRRSSGSTVDHRQPRTTGTPG